MATLPMLEYVNLLHRIHAKLGVMPARRLTFEQIVRLAGADEVTCARALRDLKASGLLTEDAGPTRAPFDRV